MVHILKLATIAVPVLMAGTLAWAQSASSVRITQVDGSVEIRKGGAQESKRAKEGDILERGDRLFARDKSGALMLWSNGSMVKAYPNTEITIAGVTFDLEKKLEATILDIHQGRLFVKAQVPEHLFSEFTVRAGSLSLRAQGAEFAVRFDPDKKSLSAWPVLGRLVAAQGTDQVVIAEGSRGAVSAGAKPRPEDIAALDDKTRQSLMKVSKDLGGSLLMEDEEEAIGGKLAVKIGGAGARRGNAPYTLNFKARAKGGSGKIKTIKWDFGDGETATTKEAKHTYRQQGLYIVTLRIEDQNGEKASAQTGISAEEDCGC